MPQAQVEAALNSPDSTLMELLSAHEEICIQYGYLATMSAHRIRQEVEADLLETTCLMMLLKDRINRKYNPTN